MKRAIIMLLLAALLLCGCAAKEITVDTEKQTISDGKYTYEYFENTSAGIRTVSIYYPDGVIYYWTEGYNSSYSDQFDSVTYTDGDKLIEALIGPEQGQAQQQEQEPNNSFDPAPFFLGLLLCGLGALQVCSPYTVWYGSLGGWKFKDAEPSDEALARIKGTGIFEIILGAVFIIAGIVGIF